MKFPTRLQTFHRIGETNGDLPTLFSVILGINRGQLTGNLEVGYHWRRLRASNVPALNALPNAADGHQ
jgi:hypothetical protein